MKLKNCLKMISAGVIAMSLAVSSMAAVAPAGDEQITEITVDEAVEIALKHSSKIGELEDTLDTLEDSRDALYSAYGTWTQYQGEGAVSDEYLNFLYTFIELDSNIENISYYNKLTEQGLRYGIMTIAVYIVEIEKAIDMQEKNFSIAKENNIINQAKYRLGMLSKNELASLQAEYESVKVALEELKTSREALYTSLYKTLGTGYNKKYVVICDPVFEAHDVSEKSLTGKINSILSNDIYLKIMKNSVSNAEYSINMYSPTGPSYDTREKTLNSANRSYKDAKAAVEKSAIDSYNKIKNYEEKQILLEKELEVANNTYNTMLLNFEMGRITKLQLEQASLAVDSAEYNLISNVYSHMLEKYVFSHPYIAAETVQ